MSYLSSSLLTSPFIPLSPLSASLHSGSWSLWGRGHAHILYELGLIPCPFSLPSTTDTGCLCVLPRFHRRFISIRWRSAYYHPTILLPITNTFNMISTLVPMDITLSMIPHILVLRSIRLLCTHFQSYLFHLTGANYLYLPCTIVRSMINHPHSPCNSVFYSTSTPPHRT